MWAWIITCAKTKLLSVITKINIKDVTDTTEKAVIKLDKKFKNVEIKEIKKKEPRWQKYFPFTFFYGAGKFQPIYFFVALFCFLAAGMLFVKIYAAWVAIKKGTYVSDMISTADLATVLTFASSLVLLYNNSKKNTIKEVKKNEGEQ